MLYMVIESNQDIDTLDMEMANHAKREWQREVKGEKSTIGEWE